MFSISNDKIGEGAFSVVYLGKLEGKDVAIKKSKKQHSKREIELLSTFSHPHIIHLYTTYSDKEYSYLFLEYCPYGNLEDYLGPSGYLEKEYILELLKQLLSALKYLYDKNIYHRDIKPQNLLLSKNKNLKLSDFSLSGNSPKNCGSLQYMAPELICNSTFLEKSDIWSVGMVIFRILYGYPYFQNEQLVIPVDNKIFHIQFPKEIEEFSFLKKMLIFHSGRIDWVDLFELFQVT